MKTNYLNAKQQMAALTLGVACLFSIAWINPAEKKKEAKKTTQHEVISITNNAGKLNTVIYQDTTKKRKVKIVVIDKNGKRTEYNSLKDMPDSLRKAFYKEELFPRADTFVFRTDSNFTFTDSLFQTKIFKRFNSPETQEKWRKYGEEMAKQYSSPEAQAKWKKLSEGLAKEYGSPEAQAKWRKFGEEMAKQYSSPEAQAKWKKLSEGLAKEYGSPEAQAKWRKMGEDMAAKINTPEFRAQMDSLRERVLIVQGHRMAKLPGINKDSLAKIYRFNYEFDSPDAPTILFRDNQSSKAVRESEEYKKLKQKFDKEVKELKEKMEKKEKSKN